ELPRCHHIGHTGTIDRPHQAGTNDGNLCRSATGMADRTHREISEQGDHSCLLQEGAKQDEQKNKSGGDVSRRSVDAFGAETHGADDLIETVAAMCQQAGQILAEEPIQQEQAANNRQSPSHYAASSLEDQNQRDDAYDHIGIGHLARTLGKIGLENPVIKAESEPKHPKRPAYIPSGSSFEAWHQSENH